MWTFVICVLRQGEVWGKAPHVQEAKAPGIREEGWLLKGGQSARQEGGIGSAGKVEQVFLQDDCSLLREKRPQLEGPWDGD